MNSELVQVKWETRKKVLFKDLNEFRSNQVHTDITLLCDGESYPAHRLILSMTSGYFARVLQTKQGQLSPSIILVCGIKAPVLKALLNFIYDGLITIKGEDVANLLQAGLMFEIPGLMEMGSDVLASSNRSESQHEISRTSPQSTFAAVSHSTVKTEAKMNKNATQPDMSEKHSGNSMTQEEGIQLSGNLDEISNNNDKDGSFNTTLTTSAQQLFNDLSNSEEGDLFEGWEVAQPAPKQKIITKGSKRSHRCPICNRGFYKAESLAIHVKTHKSTSSLVCKHCKKRFNNERIYKSHSRRCSSVTGRVKGRVFGKRVAERSNLENRKRSKRRSDSEGCTIDSVLRSVSQSFKTSFSDHDQRRHLNQYLITDDSIYDEVNSTKSPTSSPRTLLVNSHQNGSDEEPLHDGMELEHSVASILTKECKFCHQSFPSNRDYKKHRTSDCAVLECPYCLTNFQKEEKSDYRDHMNTHRHSEYPYTCPKCNFSTNRMKLFEDHISIHTGVFRFRCTYCDFQSRKEFELNNHMIQSHNDENTNLNILP